MKRLGLKVKQRVAYKVTTIRKHSDAVASNILNRQFNPSKINHCWAGDITYLKTTQGWMYLSIVMDLHSRRVVEWALSSRMTVDLVKHSMRMALSLRRPKGELIFHSDRGCQYTSNSFREMLNKNGVTASMSGKGACLDNAVVERFFGSLKNEWLLNICHDSRDDMKKDVEEYIYYYNNRRLHTTIGDLSPIEFENSKLNVCGFS